MINLILLSFSVSIVWFSIAKVLWLLKTKDPAKSANKVLAYMGLASLFLFLTMVFAIALVVSVYE